MHNQIISRYLHAWLFFLDMTEQSERYDSGDDLEFDEFLENITDKYESITEQSNSNEKERINN